MSFYTFVIRVISPIFVCIFVCIFVFFNRYSNDDYIWIPHVCDRIDLDLSDPIEPISGIRAGEAILLPIKILIAAYLLILGFFRQDREEDDETVNIVMTSSRP